MPQHRLEYYFTRTSPAFIPSGRGFLDLPRPIRDLIYDYSSLDNHFVDLNYSNLKVYARGMYPDTVDCIKLIPDEDWSDMRKVDVSDSDHIWEFCEDFDCGAIKFSAWNRPYGLHQSLLLVSKGVHEEVEALIYARATFRVCLGQPLGFKRLWHMSNAALFNLTSLTIRLDAPKSIVESSAWGDDLCPPVHINLSLKWGKVILKEWTSVLGRLARCIKPGRLSLCVIFRAKTMEDARTILHPVAQLPPLNDCAICVDLHGQDFWWQLRDRFSVSVRQYDVHWQPNETTELSNLVQQTIQKLTKKLHLGPGPFRYLDLPQELRLAILEYTDLVSSNAVQWRPRLKPSLPRYFDSCVECMTFPCICRGSRQSFLYESYPCCGHCSPDDHSGMCYCSKLGPIWSSSCECLIPRHPLFSVSSQVRQDATQVYYAHNQILITPYHSPIMRLEPQPWGSETWFQGSQHIPKIELSLYLSSIACSALQHIRWLEWVIPNRDPHYLCPNTPAWYDYLDTLLLMENAMNISALTFAIIFKSSGQEKYGPPDEKRWRWYKTIVLPLQRLGEVGLKDLFLYIRWYDDQRGIIGHHEEDLERIVMGKGYDSSARGKPEDRLWKAATEAWARY